MRLIKKNSTDESLFNRKKIKESIQSAGADEDKAHAIAEEIAYQKGLDTSTIRKQVIEKLSKHDKNVSQNYAEFKKTSHIKSNL